MFQGDGVQSISILQSQCANITFSETIRYNRMFQKVVHKVVESAINYIKRSYIANTLVISVGNSYTQDQLMRTFLEIFQQGEKYDSCIASHQTELRREERFIDQNNYLYLTSKLIIWIWKIQ